MADAADSKSADHKSCGFKSHQPHQEQLSYPHKLDCDVTIYGGTFMLVTKDIKLKIVKMHLEEGVTLRELSEQFHIHPSKSSTRWICIGYVS